MMWHPQLLALLSQGVNNDGGLLQAMQRYSPVPPLIGMQQNLGAGGTVTQPQGPQQGIGPLLAAAANKDLRQPMRSRSDWQTLGPVINGGRE
jgi:hypothetical protein